jgi:hypothetical protein
MIGLRKWAVPVALFVVLGAAPALADDSAGLSPQAEILIADGMTADEIEFLRDAGLGWPQIYLLQAAAEAFGVDVLDLYAGVDIGAIKWGKLKNAFGANYGQFVASSQKNA